MKSLDTYFDSSTQTSKLITILLSVATYIAKAIYKLLFRLKSENLDVLNQITSTSAIIAGNHMSYNDPVFVWLSIWPHRVRFMAKSELFEKPILKRLLAYLGVFPVTRGGMDRRPIKRAIASLKRGEIVGIFPEGTRVKTPGQVQAYEEGVSLIAKLAGVPVIPVGIVGANKIMPQGKKLPRFPKITLRYGKPIYFEDYADLPKGEQMTAMTKEIERRVKELVGE
jgi:1-acyl-sn-glycerol-3-phosphate acyltransferase